ncbi:MarR family winged helix-turn-helix transcriptional regulator [Thioclava sp. JM3]|uniref:MarR family winged helix-turn-helix transcriptional regulator n=2 Tax=Thioclava TaxID=285107 RepID=UPI001F0A357E|nr:MarR family winged helix-turn-helix transcriptional regulator [Thioclava sp. JM3]
MVTHPDFRTAHDFRCNRNVFRAHSLQSQQLEAASNPMTVEQKVRETADEEIPLPGFDLERFLPYLVAELSVKLSQELAAGYRDAGLTMPQWRVMVHLSHAGRVSVRDIERRTSLERPKVSRAASHLEAKGLVEKRADDVDARLVALSLTREGRRLMAELLPRAIAYQRQLEAVLGSDLAGLQRAMDKLLGTPIE